MDQRDTVINDTDNTDHPLQDEETITNYADNAENGSTSLDQTASSKETEVEKLRSEVDQYKDKYIRLVADFENYKRRNAKERMELMQTAGKEIITSLLDILDDCDRAEKQMNTSDNIEQVKQGVQLVFNKLRNTLQSKGLKPMESVNTPFDVEKHEAITEIEASEKSMKGKVIDEVVKGYYLNDKLIRFAKVVVAN